MEYKRGQISTEYLIIVGFVIFLVVSVLGLALYYSSSISDRIRFDQVNNFANKIVSSAETVFYSGEPSRVTINAYLPAGVSGISVLSNGIVINVSTASGLNTVYFESKVPLTGSLNKNEGVKKILISAEVDSARISEE